MAQPAPAGPDRYTKIRTLGHGSFGCVQLAWDRVRGCEVAVKLIERGDKVSHNVEREIVNHQRLRHPFIVRLLEVFLTPEHLAIVMEHLPEGDLFQYLQQRRSLPESEARWCFQQLVLAIDYSHRVGVANRDIKLENALLARRSPPVLKLCDFGYSKDENLQSAPGTRVGTTAYLAPEVILNTQGHKYDGKAADVWSCGVFLYILLASAYPFCRAEDEQLLPVNRMHAVLQRILALDYALPAHISPEAQGLLRSILVASPQQRPSVADILQHPWCRDGLPPEYATLNVRLLARPPEATAAQSSEQMRRTVAAAMQTDAQHKAALLALPKPLALPGSSVSLPGQAPFFRPFIAEQW